MTSQPLRAHCGVALSPAAAGEHELGFGTKRGPKMCEIIHLGCETAWRVGFRFESFVKIRRRSVSRRVTEGNSRFVAHDDLGGLLAAAPVRYNWMRNFDKLHPLAPECFTERRRYSCKLRID